MLNFIDNFLNKITMYRLVLYCLAALLAAAVVLSFFGLLPYAPVGLVISTLVILSASWVANKTFAKVFGAPVNVESVYITALILALIITPVAPSQFFSSSGLAFFFWASVWAMASKFIFAVRKKHVFNPAAFAVALTAMTLNQSASWWVGTLPMLPFVLVAGLLVVRKISRAGMVVGFLSAAALTAIGFGLARGASPPVIIWKMLAETPILFFASIMLTEPLTAPPAKLPGILYGIFVGFLFSPSIHLGQVYSTPELALVAGNIFSYLLSPKGKHVLKLKEKIQRAADTCDFLFLPDREMKFSPGQYLEWTLGHKKPDSRGNRRYFTIASSPTEKEVRLGVKFYPKPSSFKKAMFAMEPGGEIVASRPAGDFTLPRNGTKKLVFIAGGIGITPFRSMIKHLLDRNEKRPIVLLYSNKTEAEIVYRDVFDEAESRLGIRTIYALTDKNRIPPGWKGAAGRIDQEMIREKIPDYRERTFYLSGPRSLVVGFREILKNMGIADSRIKTDFFPGFA